MSNGVPKHAASLVQRMKVMQDGDAKHSADRPMPEDIRTRLDKALADLEQALVYSQATRASAHEASQTQRAVIVAAKEAASAFRKTVLSRYSDKDRVIEDYGLTVRAEPKPREKKPKKTADNKAPAA